ncbi:MAG: response regulator [Deltaproteobacteria bacterium]|nr:response regulator [Deltaproteobacteria bacterium]
MEKKAFTLVEAARICNVTHMTLWRWVKKGKIKAHRTAGGHHRIVRDDLEEFLRRNGIPYSDTEYVPKKKILVVDNDQYFRKTLYKILNSMNYEVVFAEDAFEAGELVTTFKPDIMMLDLDMPGVNGFKIAGRLKDNPLTRGTKVICLMEKVDEKARQQSREAGIEACLAKLEDKGDMFTEIQKHL